MTAVREAWPARLRWLTGLSVAAVVAVNVAGIWEIALARRNAVEEAARELTFETSARARSLESLLSSTRADLAFLTGSPPFVGLETALGSKNPREVRWRRLGAEGALLLFLRAHQELSHVLVRSVDGRPLVRAGRRGGVPVVWSPTLPASSRAPGETADPAAPRRITTLFAFEAGPGGSVDAVGLEAELDASILLAHGRSLADPSRSCSLLDGGGAALAAEPDRKAARPPPAWLAAEATVRADGWSAPSPWVLTCARPSGPAVALLEPLASRYRMTLGLNLGVMALALLLASFAIHQARRRERLEAVAREEARVRELERQLFHAERLSTVGRLAAGIAHEINNPLEGMSNYLSLTKEDLARGDAAAALKRLEGVQTGLDRAAAVVRQVLAHADPAAAPKTTLDLNAVLLRSLEFVRSRPEFGGIEFGVDLADGPPSMQGNQVMLGQVFLNLLLNACEAQPRGGEVRVRTRREGGDIVVEIADRGPGVAAGAAARIFEPFYSTKDSTGLGLSICYAIVRQHGGDLGVEDNPGGGARFRIRFPSAEEALA